MELLILCSLLLFKSPPLLHKKLSHSLVTESGMRKAPGIGLTSVCHLKRRSSPLHLKWCLHCLSTPIFSAAHGRVSSSRSRGSLRLDLQRNQKIYRHSSTDSTDPQFMNAIVAIIRNTPLEQVVYGLSDAVCMYVCMHVCMCVCNVM